MLNKILFIFLLAPLFAFDSGEKYLDKINAYQKGSYFKQQVYTEHNWKSFYKMLPAQSVIEADNYDIHLLGAAVFFATNKTRESKGLKSLQFSPQLRDASIVHTDQMIEKNFFDHFNSRTPALRTPDQRIKMFGVNPGTEAENVDYTNMAINGKTTYIQLAEKIVDEFYHSPPHRKNMMGKEFTHLGCSAMFEFKDKQGVRYIKCTQDFSGNY
jgi:uncharacterized protein YkwD